ncbi:hypothetical protein IWQ56_004880, partial [Coemansia nantahalensis]
ERRGRVPRGRGQAAPGRAQLCRVREGADQAARLLARRVHPAGDPARLLPAPRLRAPDVRGEHDAPVPARAHRDLPLRHPRERRLVHGHGRPGRRRQRARRAVPRRAGQAHHAGQAGGPGPGRRPPPAGAADERRAWGADARDVRGPGLRLLDPLVSVDVADLERELCQLRMERGLPQGVRHRLQRPQGEPARPHRVHAQRARPRLGPPCRLPRGRRNRRPRHVAGRPARTPRPLADV